MGEKKTKEVLTIQTNHNAYIELCACTFRYNQRSFDITFKRIEFVRAYPYMHTMYTLYSEDLFFLWL